jgi:hypothetical protein
MTYPKDTAARATAHLRSVRDVIEMGMRPPGAIISHTRQDGEAMLDDIDIVARAIRELSEHL